MTSFDGAPWAEASEIYARYHQESRFSVPDIVAASLEGLATLAEPYRRTGRWLDLGFGEGALLSIAERHEWRCFGTEVSPHSLEFGVNRGWTVTADPPRDPRFERASFDIVTMIEVLEHVGNPRAFLGDAVEWLRPGGLFYLTTPNARSLNRWVLGARWSIVCPPEHLTVWTASGIRRLLALNGLRCVSLRAEGFNPIEVLAHLRPGVSSSQVHRQSAGVTLSRALASSSPRRAFKTAANATLDLFGVGDTLKVTCLRNDTR